MRRVFEGGVGCVRGGMADKSIESGDRDLDVRREEMEEASDAILREMRRGDGDMDSYDDSLESQESTLSR